MRDGEGDHPAAEETWHAVAASAGKTEGGPAPGDLRERERERLWRLVALTRAVNSQGTLSAMLEQVADAALEMLEAERAFVVLAPEPPPAPPPPPEGGGERAGESPSAPPARAARFEVSRNRDHEEVREPELKVSHSLIDRVIATGEPLTAGDASAVADLPATSSILRLRLRSVCCVPLRVKGRVEGALYVDNRFRPGAFGEPEQRILEALADHAAIAIENARLVAETERRRRRAEEDVAGLRGAVETQRIELSRLTDALAARADASLQHDYATIVGRSPAIRKVLARLDRVTDSDVPVLVTGESGTGKELVARALHRNGPRREGPFICENFAALPESLVESELFGHVCGAFTGAVQDRAGLFELAHKGTLFLDEIGDMAPSIQKKLLRVLQEGEVRRVGGDRPIPVDVRIVSATHRDLAALVHKGEFREDLYYRLNVVEVRLPPLRERLEDIPALVDHFLGLAAKEEGKPKKGISRDALKLLARRSWPGNVRELANVIRRLAALGGDVISQRDVLELEGEAGPGADERGGFKTLLELEKEHMRRVLAACSWRPTEAARILGISYTTLWRKIKQYNLKGTQPPAGA